MKDIRNIGTFFFLAIITFVLWEVLHMTIPLLFPEPAIAFKTLFTQADVIFSHYFYTIFVFSCGLILSLFLAFALASLFQIFTHLSASLFSWLVILQAIPVTIGPLILSVFSSSLIAKIFIVALLSYFPIFLIVNKVMNNENREIAKTFQTMGYSSVKIFFTIRIPFVLPHIFIAMRGSLCWVFSATILTELLSTDYGLGFLIETSVRNLDTAMIFAVFIVISLSCFLFYLLLSFLQKKSIPWYK